MATEHTPGPWRVSSDSEIPWTEGDARTAIECGEEIGDTCLLFNIEAEGEFGADVVAMVPWEASGSPERLAELNANARLIASAPSMLEALKAILDVDNPRTGEPGHIGFEVAIEMGRAAIAAATGEAVEA